jgi:hypothetical protein
LSRLASCGGLVSCRVVASCGVVAPGEGFASRGREFRPAADLLSFASPKESKQRKGDPTVCDPSLRYGQPAVLAFRGVSQNSLRSNSCEPLSAKHSAPRRRQRGGGTHVPSLRSATKPLHALRARNGWHDLAGRTVRAQAQAQAQAHTHTHTPTRTRQAHAHAHAHAHASGRCIFSGRAQRWPDRSRAERSDGPLVPRPFWMRRGAERFADQGSPLFERSEFGRDPAKREHRRLPAAKRRDAASRVAFLCLLSLAKQRK